MLGIARIAGGRGVRINGTSVAMILLMIVLAAVAYGIIEEFDNAGLPLDGKPQVSQKDRKSQKAEHVRFKRNVRIAAERLKAAGIVEARRKRSRQLRTVP